jgi:hypothetical protein
MQGAKIGGVEVQTTGYVERGAGACVFGNDIGRMLGIDIDDGEPKNVFRRCRRRMTKTNWSLRRV